MPRTTTNGSFANCEYDQNEEPITISKVTMDILLREENPAYLIALYSFLYYTAKWQRTNKPKATISYICKALNWGEKRVMQTKKRLVELNLIQNVCTKSDDGKISGHYILIKFIWSKNHTGNLDQYGEKTIPAKMQGVVSEGTNALITNNKNTKYRLIGLNNAREEEILPEKNDKILPKETKDRNIIPPTLKMVTKYCTKRNNSIDPEKFIDHYKARGWKLGKEKMKDWQAAIRTWEKNDKQYSSNKTTSNKTGSRAFGIKSDYREPDYTY